MLQGHGKGDVGTPGQGRVSGSGAAGGAAGSNTSNSRTPSAGRGYLWQRQRLDRAAGSGGSSPESATGGSSIGGGGGSSRRASRSDAAASRAGSPSSSGSSTGGSGSSSGVGSSLRNLFGLWRNRAGRPATSSSSGSGAGDSHGRGGGGSSHEVSPGCCHPHIHTAYAKQAPWLPLSGTQNPSPMSTAMQLGTPTACLCHALSPPALFIFFIHCPPQLALLPHSECVVLDPLPSGPCLPHQPRLFIPYGMG
mgnify:CR=1 FL=1